MATDEDFWKKETLPCKHLELLTDRHIFTSLRNRVTKDILIGKAKFFVSLIDEA